MKNFKIRDNKKPLYELLKKKLVSYIIEHNLKTGDPFLSEKQICEKYKVSSITARRAIHELTTEGVLIRQQGIGTFVGNHTLYSEFMIGIVVFAEVSIFAQRDYYLAELLHGIDEKAKNSRIKYRIFNAEEEIHFVEILQKQKNLKGLIIVAPSLKNKNKIIELANLNIPFIVVNAKFSDDIDIDYIDSNNKDGAYQAIKYLILGGHKNILIVSDSLDKTNSFDRLEGVKEAFKKFKLPLPEENILIYSKKYSSSEEFAYKKVKNILSKRKDITAIFFGGFFLLLGGLKALKELKLKIPDDISVISFDDYPEMVLFQVPISTVYQPIREIGRLAVEKLINKINSRVSSPTKIILDCELIIRDSCKKIQ